MSQTVLATQSQLYAGPGGIASRKKLNEKKTWWIGYKHEHVVRRAELNGASGASKRSAVSENGTWDPTNHFERPLH